MSGGNVLGFAQVVREVVEFVRVLLREVVLNDLPWMLKQCAALVFPVEGFMGWLGSGASEHGGVGEALQTAGGINTSQVAGGGEKIPECGHMW